MQISMTRLLVAFAVAVLACEQAQAVVQGIDVSHFQGNINWASVKNGGIDFVFVKATEGVDFVDSKFTTYMPGGTRGQSAGRSLSFRAAQLEQRRSDGSHQRSE